MIKDLIVDEIKMPGFIIKSWQTFAVFCRCAASGVMSDEHLRTCRLRCALEKHRRRGRKLVRSLPGCRRNFKRFAPAGSTASNRGLRTTAPGCSGRNNLCLSDSSRTKGHLPKRRVNFHDYAVILNAAKMLSANTGTGASNARPGAQGFV